MYDVFHTINSTFCEKYKISYLQDPQDNKEKQKHGGQPK